MTDAERKLWHELRSRQLVGLKFRRQQPIGRFIVDFVCLERRVVIELDGGQHAERTQTAYDSERTAWLEHNGFRVLRFWDNEVPQHLDTVQAAIANAINPTSSPSTGED